MATAALTPRVRTLVICDDVAASLTEDRVFTLEGVRFEFVASHFPFRASVFVFLALSSSRKGIFPGEILLVNEQSEKVLRYVKFVAEFSGDNQLMPCALDLGDCFFPNGGLYRLEVYFSVQGANALKGEHPLTIFASEKE